MPFLTTDEFRTLYVDDSQTEVKPEQIQNCLDAALFTLEDLSGAANLQLVTNDSGTRNFINRFRKAQEYLAVGEFLLLRIAPLRNGGVLAEERDLNNSANDKYVSFKDADARYQRLSEKARSILTNYLLPVISENLRIPAGYSSSVKIIADW